MRFRLIEDQRGVWPVRVMCGALSVSPSGYYAWRSRPESPRRIANRGLLRDIQRVHARHRERYGRFLRCRVYQGPRFSEGSRKGWEPRRRNIEAKRWAAQSAGRSQAA